VLNTQAGQRVGSKKEQEWAEDWRGQKESLESRASGRCGLWLGWAKTEAVRGQTLSARGLIDIILQLEA
jgi:hypothetical protein